MRPRQPIEWARDQLALGDEISRLAMDPDTAKDATILWLSIRLDEALLKLAQIRSVAR